jgi:hypothetical protein
MLADSTCDALWIADTVLMSDLSFRALSMVSVTSESLERIRVCVPVLSWWPKWEGIHTLPLVSSCDVQMHIFKRPDRFPIWKTMVYRGDERPIAQLPR